MTLGQCCQQGREVKGNLHQRHPVSKRIPEMGCVSYSITSVFIERFVKLSELFRYLQVKHYISYILRFQGNRISITPFESKGPTFSGLDLPPVLHFGFQTLFCTFFLMYKLVGEIWCLPNWPEYTHPIFLPAFHIWWSFPVVHEEI